MSIHPVTKAAASRPKKIGWTARERSLVQSCLSLLLLAAIAIAGASVDVQTMTTSLENRNLAPSFSHPFGTDWLGRDMLNRTLRGLVLSMQVGLIGAVGSTMIAAILGVMAATLGRWADRVISWLMDLFLSVPHLVTLILIAFVSGGGGQGIIVGIALTHWPSLARVIRAEALQLMSEDYVKVSRRLGKSRLQTAISHLTPHLFPQLLVGFLLMFPHAVLHEAAVTFLGLGLSPHQPAIGIILSESMRYLSTGMWWLAVFPGLGLLLTVRAFDRIGESLRLLIDPRRAQE
jgi:peptide/nickel transport system permease protein